jgi:hypothetical protein
MFHHHGQQSSVIGLEVQKLDKDLIIDEYSVNEAAYLESNRLKWHLRLVVFGQAYLEQKLKHG